MQPLKSRHWRQCDMSAVATSFNRQHGSSSSSGLKVVAAMEEQLRQLIIQFLTIHGVQGVVQPPLPLQFENAPHTRPGPLRNQIGVYLFFKDEEWLRVGQTSYSPRFTSQHYGTRRAQSNFARDIWANRQEFGYQGQEDQIDTWLLQNFGRANIRLDAWHGDAMSRFLEAYLHLHLSPRFEGRR